VLKAIEGEQKWKKTIASVVLLPFLLPLSGNEVVMEAENAKTLVAEETARDGSSCPFFPFSPPSFPLLLSLPRQAPSSPEDVKAQ